MKFILSSDQLNLKYLLITLVIGGQMTITEVNSDYIYHYNLDPLFGDDYLIDRKNDSIYIIKNGMIKSSRIYLNESSHGWSAGEEIITGQKEFIDSSLGPCLEILISKKIKDTNIPWVLNNSKSHISKSYISIDNEYIKKYFHNGDKLEYRILTWNKYENADQYPFLIRTDAIYEKSDTYNIVKVSFEEKEIDDTFRMKEILVKLEDWRD